jgi:hypothetical protein
MMVRASSQGSFLILIRYGAKIRHDARWKLGGSHGLQKIANRGNERLDFDIDEAVNNRVYLRDNNSWRFYPKEANDLKNPATNRVWFVRNERTGHGAWIMPTPDDGQADRFSGIDIGVRLYHAGSEEDHPWQFGTNGLGFLNGEYVRNSDIVFWYISHMFHRAREGGDHWHSTGPNIQIHKYWLN